MILKAKARFSFSQTGEDMQFTDHAVKGFIGTLAMAIAIGTAAAPSGISTAEGDSGTQTAQIASERVVFGPDDDNWP
ncbi:hypothetical protein ACIQ6Y_31475 [Streptomyces sp. NPDC096205]|uniref:hypothetical protein n=1 Tax=Streptomyces sp. NPDC096205 TaxID=3366081 RepID=UPI003814654F